MTKTADQYLKINPWVVIEEGFHPDKSRVSESIFSLGNEFMGVRGYLEEGYSGDSLIGSYFNGVYEETEICHPQYFKGLATRSCFLVNAVNWLFTRIHLDGDVLNLNHNQITEFNRRLDIKIGSLERTLVWETMDGKQVRVTFQRFLSMVQHNLAGQRMTFEALNFSGSIEVETGLDFSPMHELSGKNYWSCPHLAHEDSITAIFGETKTSGQKVFSSFRLESDAALTTKTTQRKHYAGVEIRLYLVENQPVSVDKLVYNYVDKRVVQDAGTVFATGLALAKEQALSFDQALREHSQYWEDLWDTLDVTIEGDPETNRVCGSAFFSCTRLIRVWTPT